MHARLCKAKEAHQERDAAQEQARVAQREKALALKAQASAEQSLQEKSQDLESWALWWAHLQCNLRDAGKEGMLAWIKRMGFKVPKRLAQYVTD